MLFIGKLANFLCSHRALGHGTFFLYAAIVLFTFMGCSSTQSTSSMVAAAGPLVETDSEYRLQVGDVVEVKFFYNPELNESQTIRPDGKITLQLIDEVEAAGLTPSELDRSLTEKYSSIIRQPTVAVIVKEYSGQKVYVGGEVNTPGLIPIVGRLTTLQAILHANGFKNTAELSSVVILRNQGTSTPLFLTVDLEQLLKATDLQNDIVLKPHDIVFVPKTTIAKMNQFVEQYIDKLLPISRSFGLTYNLNPLVRVEQD